MPDHSQECWVKFCHAFQLIHCRKYFVLFRHNRLTIVMYHRQIQVTNLPCMPAIFQCGYFALRMYFNFLQKTVRIFFILGKSNQSKSHIGTHARTPCDAPEGGRVVDQIPIFMPPPCIAKIYSTELVVYTLHSSSVQLHDGHSWF